LLALARSFSAFFALANADLADFLALTLAAVAASKAILEASSSAFRDETRALATFRAPEFNKEERKSQEKKQRQACKDKQVLKTRFTFRGLVTTQDFIKFWGKFFAFVLLEMIGISQGFKTFESI
jgi:hypothetical protein